MAHDARTAYGSARYSPQRERIALVIDAFGRAFTADELVAALADGATAQAGAPGTATVYRALVALEESGYVARVGERDGATLYARCSTEGHHHHFVCTVCGSVTAAECPIEESTFAAAARQGFVITHHEITLHGVCHRCLTAGWDREAH